ncbi:MAG: chorismate-binding protein [Actinomycetales bacterium]|nr:chorismate-binding protein [Actinomycetales bacterium]
MSESAAAAARSEPYSWFGGRLATGLVDVTDDPQALDSSGFWAVCITYEGAATFARFADVRTAPLPAGDWQGPSPERWETSLDRRGYIAAVERVKERIAAGDIYQGNVCRVLSAPLPDPAAADPAGLASLLAHGNPAPYAGAINLPTAGVRVVTASPELFLSRAGRTLTSRPIKGTAATAGEMLEKDIAENVMIVDLVRNDLSVVCAPGTVDVPEVVVPEEHPGLVHLVSTVTGTLRSDCGWPQILSAAFPPGSVTGCPKPRAVDLLAEVERGPRGPYCGAIGWVDADTVQAQLAVGIRTFWIDRDRLWFGTGAGITAGSDPQGEWEETELKAHNLLRVAAGRC